jgi:hypothetical protein
MFFRDTLYDGTGLVFLDHAFTTAIGLRLLSQYTGHPESTGSTTSTASPNWYEATQEHDILAGIDVGEQWVHEAGTGWHAWFDGYEGEGRQVIAEVGNQAGHSGHGIGVDERSNNRHALLSSHGVSATRFPPGWSPTSQQVFLNAVEWVSPPPDEDRPVFVPSGLEVSPDVVLGGEPVGVSVNVTNVGSAAGEHTATLLIDGSVEDATTVSLAPGQSTSVEWTVTRDQIATYQVQVGHLEGSFRVRAPVVDLTVSTLEGAGMDPGPMADAEVALVFDGQLVGVGMTDGDGQLSFEAPLSDATYTVVVRRAATDDHELAYLLTRPERVDDDATVTMAPRTLAAADDAGAQFVWNFSALVDLELDAVGDGHHGMTYLRSGLTAPFGFGFEPGPLVTTVSDDNGLEAVNVHAVDGLERDWLGVSDLIDGLVWRDPIAYSYPFGGDAQVELDASFTDGTEFTADWQVTDAHGHPFTKIASTALRPFVDLPDVLELEQVAGHVESLAPNPGEVIMRVFDPDGQGLHGGGIDWEDRTVVRDLADMTDDMTPGAYTLEIEIDTGLYSGTLLNWTDLMVEDPDDAGPGNGNGNGGGNGGGNGRGGGNGGGNGGGPPDGPPGRG